VIPFRLKPRPVTVFVGFCSACGDTVVFNRETQTATCRCGVSLIPPVFFENARKLK
jgi:hypothetical protein